MRMKYSAIAVLCCKRDAAHFIKTNTLLCSFTISRVSSNTGHLDEGLILEGFTLGFKIVGLMGMDLVT